MEKHLLGGDCLNVGCVPSKGLIAAARVAAVARGAEAFGVRIGGVDVDDLVAARHWLVGSRIADPDLVILNGYSYGGYLTLQCMGTHPELWAGGIAGAPVADWVVGGEDQNAMLDAYDLALFGTDKETGHNATWLAIGNNYFYVTWE